MAPKRKSASKSKLAAMPKRSADKLRKIDAGITKHLGRLAQIKVPDQRVANEVKKAIAALKKELKALKLHPFIFFHKIK
jgi:hypothetical protein